MEEENLYKNNKNVGKKAPFMGKKYVRFTVMCFLVEHLCPKD
jgi:hypothetical protein